MWWPFKRKPETDLPKPRTGLPHAAILPGVVCNSDLDFYGERIDSPNGEYVLSFGSVKRRSASNPRRLENVQMIILLRNSETILFQEFPQAFQGYVGNDGTFLVHDRKNSNTLANTFHVLDSTGQEILNRRFLSNPYNNWISPDSKYAVVQTCNSDKGGSMLALFDLVNRQELFCRSTGGAWANNYEIDEGPPPCLVCRFSDVNKIRYTFGGKSA